MKLILSLGVIFICQQYGLLVRMCVVDEENQQKISRWGAVFSPVPNYLETVDLGPYPIRQVKWIEVDMTHTKDIGRLVPPKKTDYANVIKDYFAELITQVNDTENVIRIYLDEL